MAKFYFDKNLAGKPFVGTSDYATIANNSLVAYDNGQTNKGRYAYLTGYYAIEDDVKYLQTTTNNVWLVNVGSTPDWKETNSIRPKTYSQTQAQYLIDKITKNNFKILQNNLLCARYASRFSAQQQAQIRALQERLQARNSALQAEGLVNVRENAAPAGYAELEPYLAKLMNGQAIGVATWVVIVIVATVITGLGTAAYFAYKSLADESERDVKFSDELTRTLVSKLTPEEYEQLRQETKGIVTKSRIKQSLSSYGNILWIAGAVVGGALLYRWLKERI